MILIADGGSTKCDWVLLDHLGKVVFKTRTEGINPAVLEKSILEKRLRDNLELKENRLSIEEVHFYGAGCGTIKPVTLLKNIFETFFEKATIQIQEDMVAAVYAVTTQPGIVCILGTGSNSCYYDGNTINTGVDSLGYVLMDEASGNYFGKALIRDYYYGKMPKDIALNFENAYDLTSDMIKENVYKKPNPNTYLASFAEFMFTSEPNKYFDEIITEGLQEFIETKVLCYDEAKDVPIHFIGSIAHFSQDIIIDIFQSYGLKLGSIVQRPIDGIIEYYQNEVIKTSK